MTLKHQFIMGVVCAALLSACGNGGENSQVDKASSSVTKKSKAFVFGDVSSEVSAVQKEFGNEACSDTDDRTWYPRVSSRKSPVPPHNHVEQCVLAPGSRIFFITNPTWTSQEKKPEKTDAVQKTIMLTGSYNGKDSHAARFLKAYGLGSGKTLKWMEASAKDGIPTSKKINGLLVSVKFRHEDEFRIDIESATPVVAKLVPLTVKKPKKKTLAKLNCTGVPMPKANNPTADVVGLYLGMKVNDAETLIRCRDSKFAVDFQDKWHVDDLRGTDVKTRQIMRATIGEKCKTDNKTNARISYNARNHNRRTDDCGTYDSVQAYTNISDRFNVVLSGMPKQEYVRAIYRKQKFEPNSQPVKQQIIDGIISKYGQPHVVNEGRRYDITYTWVYDIKGVPLAKNKRWVCESNIQPSFRDSQKWKSECGTTITIGIHENEENPDLVKELFVAVMNQRDLYVASQELVESLNAVRKERQQRELDKARKNNKGTEF